MLVAIRVQHLMISRMGKTAMVLLILVAAGCTPKDGTMKVAYMCFNADYSMRPGIWNEGETKECQIASRSTEPPDKRGDLLICGNSTQTGWSISWLRPDIKSQIYENASTMSVTFHSAGHSSKVQDTWWSCKRIHENVRCD